MTNEEKVKFYKTNIIRDNKNYDEEIKLMEKEIKNFMSEPLLYVQKYLPFNTDFTTIYDQCTNDIKRFLKTIFDDAQYVKNYDIILFPDIQEHAFYNGFFDKLNRHDEGVQKKITSTIYAQDEEVKKIKSKVQTLENLIKTQDQKNSVEKDEVKRKKTMDLINQSRQKQMELEKQIKVVEKVLYEGLFKNVINFFNTKIMKWFYLHNKIINNNDKINLLDRLGSLLKTFKKTKQDLQNENINDAVLFVLLQEDLQCCNIEISTLLAQGFIFSPLNQALNVQKQLNGKMFSIPYLNGNMKIKTLRNLMTNYYRELFLSRFYENYKNFIYENLQLQNELYKTISPKMFESREKDLQYKKQAIEIDYNLTVNELANIHKNKKELLQYYCKEFNLTLEKDGSIEQIIEQGKLPPYLQEYVDFMFEDLILTKNKQGEFILGTKSNVEELKFFYNDEFYIYNNELINKNKQELKDFIVKLEKSDKITPDDVTVIKIFICCHISSLLINFYYYKNKQFVLDNYPAISIKETTDTVYIKSLVQEVKESYKKLFLEN